MTQRHWVSLEQRWQRPSHSGTDGRTEIQDDTEGKVWAGREAESHTVSPGTMQTGLLLLSLWDPTPLQTRGGHLLLSSQ